MKVCYLDHYDSFSFNLIDCLFSDSSLELFYVPYDKLDQAWICEMPLIISPGPKRPESLPLTMDLINRSIGKVPILGVCLGHQCLGYALGAPTRAALNPFHGTAIQINLNHKVDGLPNYPARFLAAQYNSLVIDEAFLTEENIWARNGRGEVQGIVIKDKGPFMAWGVQFHPESFLSEHRHLFIDAWTKMVKDFYANYKNHLNY